MGIKICGIYCIENSVDNKKYVGQSEHCNKRVRTHINNLNKNKSGNSYLQRAWNKYGQNVFNFYIIEECHKDDLNSKEIEYIVKLESHCSCNGYNISWGGESAMRNLKHSAETKTKMSNKRRGIKREPMSDEQKKKLSNGRKGSLHWNFGKKHKAETIEKMKLNHNGYKHSFTDEEKLRMANNRRGKINRRKTSTHYKGVTLHKMSGKWRARVLHNYKEIYLGLYLSPEEAARAYDNYCWDTYKRKDMLNFPDEK